MGGGAADGGVSRDGCEGSLRPTLGGIGMATSHKNILFRLDKGVAKCYVNRYVLVSSFLSEISQGERGRGNIPRRNRKNLYYFYFN